MYLTGILTELELTPDQRITEQVCIGESCSRCLHSCPAEAVQHWGIDKRACATEAQEFGFGQIAKFFNKFIDQDVEAKKQMTVSRDLFGFWQGLLRVVGSFGDCPRCLAVCPVGNDYHAHLAEVQKVIPEKTPEKMTLAKQFKAARVAHDDGSGAVATAVPGLSAWNRRWVGEEGYQGMVAKQLQAFKQAQREREAGLAAAGATVKAGDE